MSTTPAPAPRLYRIILHVSNIERGAEFYHKVLGLAGDRVNSNRHYFDCGGTILALVEPPRKGTGRKVKTNPAPIYFAVAGIESLHARAREAGCRSIDEGVEEQHWGERAFFAEDPFGNPICFVDAATIFTGK